MPETTLKRLELEPKEQPEKERTDNVTATRHNPTITRHSPLSDTPGYGTNTARHVLEQASWSYGVFQRQGIPLVALCWWLSQVFLMEQYAASPSTGTASVIRSCQQRI